MSWLHLYGGPDALPVSHEASHVLGGASVGTLPADRTAMNWPQQALAARLLEATENGWCERWTSDSPCHAGHGEGMVWRRSGDVLYGVLEVDETVFAASTVPPLQAATESAYRQIFALLAAEKLPQLWRAWNYLPAINAETHGLERYRQFNSGRQDAFLACHASITGSVPAACALGFSGGPLSIAFMAGKTPALPIENPRQVSAYHYPPDYGPRSPTFSRAALVYPPGQEILFISGTASILGHRTVHPGNVAAQTRESLNNVLAVLTEANRRARGGIFQARELIYRVYVRHAEDQPMVAQVLALMLGAVNLCYIEADVCRSDLLVEIEATGVHAS